jgi:hypothetical protein
MLSNPSAADTHSTGVALSSVGLVTPLVPLGAPAKAAAPPQQAMAPQKPLSAFDLAKARADERAAQELQQVHPSSHVSRHFCANHIFSSVPKNCQTDQRAAQQLQRLPQILPSLLLLPLLLAPAQQHVL